jgi:hypothetical protein
VIVDPAGYIITNAHVVSGAERVRVALTIGTSAAGAAGRPLVGPILDARVVGADVETDIAVLKVDTTGLPAMPFGDSDRLRKGELVFAFGSPAGLANTVTWASSAPWPGRSIPNGPWSTSRPTPLSTPATPADHSPMPTGRSWGSTTSS